MNIFCEIIAQFPHLKYRFMVWVNYNRQEYITQYRCIPNSQPEFMLRRGDLPELLELVTTGQTGVFI